MTLVFDGLLQMYTERLQFLLMTFLNRAFFTRIGNTASILVGQINVFDWENEAGYAILGLLLY
jgi:hypothetical protein